MFFAQPVTVESPTEPTLTNARLNDSFRLDIRCSMLDVYSWPRVQILGIRFFNGDVDEAIHHFSARGISHCSVRNLFYSTAQ